MAILEKEVWVSCGMKTDVHYESLGYTIPKKLDIGSLYKVKKGTKIKVNIDDLSEGSRILVTKICDICEQVVGSQEYVNVVKSRVKNNGRDVCIRCSTFIKWENRLSNIKTEQTLYYYAKENAMEYLIKEFSDENTTSPNAIFYGSQKECLWICFKCKNIYAAQAVNRTIGKTGCPYCAGLKVKVGFNDLYTTQPKIANLLVDKDLGYKVTQFSNKKVDMLCPDCNTISVKKVSGTVMKGFSCLVCSDSISYPEKFVSNLLKQMEIEYSPQKSFKWSNNKRYDFYLESSNCIIETHGIQHYKATFSGRTLKDEQNNDKLKECLAKTNGIQHYIKIDCSESSLNFIRNSILSSELALLFNLIEVDWMKCHEYACNSIVKQVCRLWNDGLGSTEAIGKQCGISQKSVIKYLKRGSELGWCNYDPKKTQINSGAKLKEINKRKVIQHPTRD